MRNFDQQAVHLEFLSATQELVSRYEKHIFFDPTGMICPNLKCSPFLNNKMVFVDVSHLSPSGSRLLTPLYVAAIKEVLEQK
ncbi:MAG: SGNH hydrolase domain-containing protein, partial [Acidimicrobiaceae bacterium]